MEPYGEKDCQTIEFIRPQVLFLLAQHEAVSRVPGKKAAGHIAVLSP